ncbi:hypothetical protein [Streptomyces sp. 049-1]|uniref:hypothetical protein n=1 Tax=Streptomyces sp. 049-1 TaxID=2789264 RepID=UPI0039816BB7
MRKQLGIGALTGLFMLSGAAVAGNAQAAEQLAIPKPSPGVFTLCANGGYDVNALIPEVSTQHIPGLVFGNTPGVYDGTCSSFYLGSSTKATAYIYNAQADHGDNIKQIAQVKFDGAHGLTVTTLPNEQVTTEVPTS